MIYIAGPGHGGPGVVASTYLEGTYSEYYPNVSRDEEGMKRLFTQFSFPGGIPSHCAPETPGSIHEGGELGYSLLHAFGAAFDNPDLLACCVVGDGEAESGPLAASWHSNKFLNPVRDGAVLPILHLNGYKIANPTVLARLPDEELVDQSFHRLRLQTLFHRGARTGGHAPAHGRHSRSGARGDPGDSERDARANGFTAARTLADDRAAHAQRMDRAQGSRWQTRRRHVARASGAVSRISPRKPAHLHILEDWMKSYRPEELFDAGGTLIAELQELAPRGERRMSDNPHTNGGLLRRDLKMPDFCNYAVAVPKPGTVVAEATRQMGKMLRDVMKRNAGDANFRVFGPDETASNRLDALFEITDRTVHRANPSHGRSHLSETGRVMEVLSEHMCQGWLEGYLLTGRHGFFSCYEAFIHIVDSMFNQHAKWLKVTRNIPWRRPIASLNYLLSSHVWRQDHNGFSHQDPGFIDHVVNKKADVVRVYLPPDANTLLSVADHCLRSRHYVNVIVAGKQPALQWLNMESAIEHCTTGIGIWEWASTDNRVEPDVVMACCGDVPTLETLAAVDILRRISRT